MEALGQVAKMQDKVDGDFIDDEEELMKDDELHWSEEGDLEIDEDGVKIVKLEICERLDDMLYGVYE